MLKTPAGCPGVSLSSLPPCWPGSHQFLQHQPEGNRVGEQTKIIPTDRAGSVLTFCKWFPFIKAAHEWLVVVRCTLYLPDTSTAFWTHLIKQIVNMRLVFISFHSPSQIPGDLPTFSLRPKSRKEYFIKVRGGDGVKCSTSSCEGKTKQTGKCSTVLAEMRSLVTLGIAVSVE